MEFKVQTEGKHQVVDITDQVQALVTKQAKMVVVFVAHTTCAITTADLDPGAGEDLMQAVWQMIPKLKFERHHDPSHFPAHVAASVIGPSVILPVKQGKLVLGSWQRIILAEFDGPRQRQLLIVSV